MAGLFWPLIMVSCPGHLLLLVRYFESRFCLWKSLSYLQSTCFDPLAPSCPSWQLSSGRRQAAIIGVEEQKGCHCLSCHRKLLQLHLLSSALLLNPVLANVARWNNAQRWFCFFEPPSTPSAAIPLIPTVFILERLSHPPSHCYCF